MTETSNMDAEIIQKVDRTGDMVVAILAIINVGLLAVLEACLVIPVVLREAHSTTDAIYLVSSYIAVILLWLYCLFVEHRHMYERKEAAWHRRRGNLLQFMVLGTYTVSQIQDKHPQGLIVIVAIALLALAIWRVWMRSLQLAPEQQKAIDDLLAERDRRFKERIAAEQNHLRQRRFEAVASHYGLPEAPVVEETDEEKPVIDWRIPKGRHTAIVYFLRNGDRIKIGTTTDLHARVRRLSLRMDNLALAIPGDRTVERQMHQAFKSLRVGNTEWFKNTGELASFIRGRTEQVLAEAKD